MICNNQSLQCAAHGMSIPQKTDDAPSCLSTSAPNGATSPIAIPRSGPLSITPQGVKRHVSVGEVLMQKNAVNLALLRKQQSKQYNEPNDE